MRRIVLVVLGLIFCIVIGTVAFVVISPRKTTAPLKHQITGDLVLSDKFILEDVKPARRYRIGVLLPFIAIPYWRNEAFGVFQEAERLGIDVVWYSSDGYENIERQNRQVEDLITQRVDAILLAATSSYGTVPVVQRAVEAGIPVINHVSITDSPAVSAIVIADNFRIGHKQGEAMCGLLNNSGEVAMLSGPAAAEWATDRAQGFKAALSEGCPQIQITVERFSNPGRPDGQKLAEDLIVTFPNLNGLYTAGDGMAMGAADALKSAGKIEHISITTAGFFEETKPYVESGAIKVAVDESAVLNGRLAVVRAVQVLNGEKPPRVTILPAPLRTRDSIRTLDTAELWAPADWRIK